MWADTDTDPCVELLTNTETESGQLSLLWPIEGRYISLWLWLISLGLSWSPDQSHLFPFRNPTASQADFWLNTIILQTSRWIWKAPFQDKHLISHNSQFLCYFPVWRSGEQRENIKWWIVWVSFDWGFVRNDNHKLNPGIKRFVISNKTTLLALSTQADCNPPLLPIPTPPRVRHLSTLPLLIITRTLTQLTCFDLLSVWGFKPTPV